MRSAAALFALLSLAACGGTEPSGETASTTSELTIRHTLRPSIERPQAELRRAGPSRMPRLAPSPCGFTGPEQLRFGVVRPGNTATIEVAIENHDASAACSVRDIVVAPELGGAAIADFELRPGASARIPLTVRPEQTPEAWFVAHSARINGRYQEKSLRIHRATQDPCAIVTPAARQFTAGVGCVAEGTVTVLNICEDPITLVGVGLDGEGFEAAARPLLLTLQQGQETQVAVRFAPTAPGAYTATLSAEIDSHGVAGNEAPYTVSLAGTATSDTCVTP